jgi:hypothetical protein
MMIQKRNNSSGKRLGETRGGKEDGTGADKDSSLLEYDAVHTGIKQLLRRSFLPPTSGKSSMSFEYPEHTRLN